MPVTINGTAGITFNNSSTSSVGGLGDGQTWQNMTASRSSGVTYTNSTGKPISIIVTCGLNGSTISLTIAGSVRQSMGNTGAGNGNVTGIVPNGATYSVTAPSTIDNWSELR